MVQPHKAKETNYLLPIKTLVRNMVNGTCSHLEQIFSSGCDIKEFSHTVRCASEQEWHMAVILIDFATSQTVLIQFWEKFQLYSDYHSTCLILK